MGNKLSLDPVQHIERLLVFGRDRGSSYTTVGGQFVHRYFLWLFGRTLSQVCKEQVETLDHNLASLLLVDIVLQIIDFARRADPLLAISRIL